MWCKWCLQHVPAARSETSSELNCARCSRPLGARGPADTPSDKLAHAADCGIDLGVVAATGDFADWELDQHVRRLQARVGTWRRLDPPRSEVPQALRSHERPSAPSQPAAARRIDGPQAVGGPHSMPRVRRSSRLGWALLGLGLMAFTCGTCLLIGSWVEARPELWSLGVPIAIGGQIGLFMGLVLQLERIWQSSRQAVHQLETVDAQLRQLQRATADWTAHQGTAAEAFQNQPAEPTGPKTLLTGRHGQLNDFAPRFDRAD